MLDIAWNWTGLSQLSYSLRTDKKELENEPTRKRCDLWIVCNTEITKTVMKCFINITSQTAWKILDKIIFKYQISAMIIPE